MRFPSKVTRYNDSIISKFPIILTNLQNGDLQPGKLYISVKKKICNIGEYMEILDCLYALGKIEMTQFGALHYVG